MASPTPGITISAETRELLDPVLPGLLDLMARNKLVLTASAGVVNGRGVVVFVCTDPGFLGAIESAVAEHARAHTTPGSTH